MYIHFYLSLLPLVGRGVCVVEHGAELSTLVVGHGEVVEHLDHVVGRGCTRLF